MFYGGKRTNKLKEVGCEEFSVAEQQMLSWHIFHLVLPVT